VGYCSNFEITTVGNEHVNWDLVIELIQINAVYSMEKESESVSCYDVKWYSHVADISAMSNFIKDVTFMLHRDGEGESDIERIYFRNGKIQHCAVIITFEEFVEANYEVQKCRDEIQKIADYIKRTGDSEAKERALQIARTAALSKLTEKEREVLGL